MVDRLKIIAFISAKYSSGELTAAMLRDMVKQGYITEEERGIIVSSKNNSKP